jgi:hypothetical protein
MEAHAGVCVFVCVCAGRVWGVCVEGVVIGGVLRLGLVWGKGEGREGGISVKIDNMEMKRQDESVIRRKKLEKDRHN